MTTSGAPLKHDDNTRKITFRRDGCDDAELCYERRRRDEVLFYAARKSAGRPAHKQKIRSREDDAAATHLYRQCRGATSLQ